jgi:murein DD-endopeptidase MepM/ murein hydrolase activator NlpD
VTSHVRLTVARLKTRIAAALAVGLVASTLVAQPPAQAAVTADSIVPFVGSALVGCTKNSSHPICEGNYHPYDAIDFLLSSGSSVIAPVDGSIRAFNNSCPATRLDGCGSGFGNWIRVAGNDGRDYLMAHLSSVLVTSGPVAQGQVIGRSGSSGTSTTPHIHYEERTPAGGLSGSRLVIGAMTACVNQNTQASYPSHLGYGSWNQVPAHSGKYVTNTNDCWRTGESVAEGDFVRATDNGEVYRIAGGAPVYVSTWTAFGGPKPTRDLTRSQLNALPVFPRDGTFVSASPGGHVFRIAGGAPLYVSTWDRFGGPQPTTVIDKAAIDNAGAGGPWNHLRQVPADGTFVSASPGGHVFRIAGGAPLYVSTWDRFGGPQPTTVIDKAAIDNAGRAYPYNHLRFYPADGTFVKGTSTPAVYRAVGGSFIHVTSWDAFGSPQPTTTVDQVTLQNPDGGYPYNHLRRYPADGARMNAQPSGRIWDVMGGARYVGSNAAGGVTFNDADVTAVPPAQSLHGLSPVRRFDTRTGSGGVPAQKLGARQTLEVAVTGRDGVPSSKVSAVVLNVTATEPNASGYVTVFPCGSQAPLASNLNFVAGQTVPNSVVAPVGAGGKVCFYSSAATHLLADVSGWVETQTGFGAIAPVRRFDTRTGSGGVPAQKLGARQTLEVAVTGQDGVPSSKVSAVVLNVTATEASASGYVTVFPCGSQAPLASNLNFVAGQTVPNSVVAPVGAGGKVCFYSSAATHLLADVSGWYSTP